MKEKRITVLWKENPPDSPDQVLGYKNFVISALKPLFTQAVECEVTGDILTPMWGHCNTTPIKTDAVFNMDHSYLVNFVSSVEIANANG